MGGGEARHLGNHSMMVNSSMKLYSYQFKLKEESMIQVRRNPLIPLLRFHKSLYSYLEIIKLYGVLDPLIPRGSD